MAKINLSDEDLKILSECINSQTEIPEDLLLKLSPGFFEKLRQTGKFDYRELDKYRIPTIEYAGKRSESVILAQAHITGGAAPLQIVRSFANGKNGEWKNLIVQGDNLQFLKTCYMNQDPLIKNKVKGKVKLICIDPPFATKSDFQGSDDERSYSDKINTAEFIESLRERLIYLKEIVSEDGCIYVHLDQKMSHYVKVVMDELFGKACFQNEVSWCYREAINSKNRFNRKHDNILFYSKGQIFTFNYQNILEPHSESTKKKYKLIDDEGRRYRLMGRGIVGSPIQSARDVGPEWEEKHPELVYRHYETEGTLPVDYWNIDIINQASAERLGYPTQKPEKLLERVVLASSNPGDLVFDIFAGSGTAATVAEKLGRRWIVCDFGKHAIYTMQKRVLNISDSKKLGSKDKLDQDVQRCEKCNSVTAENGEYKKCKECGAIYQKEGKEKFEKYGQPPKPFCVVSAGAYDFSRIMDLRKNKEAYISFVLGLFSISREHVDYSKKYKLSNIYAEKDNNPVEVYPVWEDEYLKEVRIDEDYLKDILSASGGKLKGDYYIVTPETCTIISDTTLKNKNNEKVNFKLLKFPYKVLEDVSRHFQIEEQASSATDINRLISSAGFYFNEEVKIEVEKVKGGLKITNFKTGILNKNKERFKGLEGLSMLLIDLDYDGKIFDMDVAIYSKEIKEDGFVKVEGLIKNSRLIAIDKHGNESKITKIG